MDNKFKLPDGVIDYLPKECYIKKIIEKKLSKTFDEYGYENIDTPILERYALFDSGVGKVDLRKLFKVTDVDGDLLVLRPDMTLPISRIVSTKLSDSSYKFQYSGKSFSMLENSGKLREFSQVGVEVMGSKGTGVDIELVALAIKAFLEVGLKNFQIELGHVGFFKGLISSLNLDSKDKEELTDLVEKKDSIGEQIFAKKRNIENQDLAIMLKLPMLFGGIEVLDEALPLCKNEEMKSSIENLRKIYLGLEKIGYAKYVSFDLSLVANMKYYSALVMKGITKYAGRSILSGGRYDELCNSFGRNVPANGFAISVNELMSALLVQGEFSKEVEVDYVIGFDPEFAKEAEALYEKLTKEGKNVKKSFATTVDQLIKCKEIIKAKTGLFVQDKEIKEV